MNGCILVTGGAGYIGSHTCIELLQAGFRVVVVDNFSNSRPEALSRVQRISGKKFDFVRADIRDQSSLEQVIRQYGCDAVVHFAGLKAVGESVENPLAYYDNNVLGSFRLVEAMKNCGVKKLVFSSSATVYGEPKKLPLAEDHPLSATNPYGRTKLIVEDMLRDLYCSDPSWHITLLRYFNPVGAHPSGLLGEDPQGIPNNLMPFVAQVAVGRREKLNIWGNDYSTPDGTGVRDYIHVVDLAIGHIRALESLTQPQCLAVNLGTGRGYSVLEVIAAFEKACDRVILYEFAPRRSGDVASCYADPSFAEQLLGWRASRDLDAMCRDAWHWQCKYPNGFLN